MVIKFGGFRGHWPNRKKSWLNFVRLRACKNTHRRGARQAQEWHSFVTFVQPLTTEEKLCVLFSFAITCSLIYEYYCTTNPEKGMVITPITNPRKLKPLQI